MRPFVVVSSLLALAAAVAASAACADPPPAREPLPFPAAGPDAAPDPSKPGPYPVGVRTMTFVDDERTTPGKDGPRTLVVEVWYPAAESARGAPGTSYVLYDQLPPDLQEGLAPEDLGTVETDAVRDAPARAGEVFPVVVFSHGKGGVRQQSTFYTVPLASHGYVVVAPDHEGDTVVDLLRSRDLALDDTVTHGQLRPRDVSFLLTSLEELPDDEPLKPILDLRRVGATGHSFGAFTSFRAAGGDDRIDAIVAHTPVGYTPTQLELETRIEDFGIPYLIAAGGLDRTLPADVHADSLWAHMTPPRFYLTLSRAGHFTFSDLCVLDVAAIDAALDIDASNVLEDGCGPENTPAPRAQAAIDHYSIGLFNAYLRASTGTLDLLTQEAGEPHAPDDVVFLADR